MFGTGIVDHEARFEIIERVKDEIHVTEIVLDVRGIHIFDFRFDFNGRIDPAQFRFGGDGLGEILLNIFLVEQRLPLKIRQLDKVAIDDSKKANAGAHQLVGGNGAERTEADEQNAG